MPIRIIPIAACGLAMFVGCERSADSKLVGSWRVTGRDDAGQINYRKDHTFTSREWAVTYTHQPPVVFDTGKWQLRENKLVMDFNGGSHPRDATHMEFSLAVFDDDHLVIRQRSGVLTMLERQK